MKDMHGSGKLERGKCVGIPYSILVPKGWENLWVAGRCHSSDTKVHGSIRAQSAAFMMGQAAATAAVQAITTGAAGLRPRHACSVETLRAHGLLSAARAFEPNHDAVRLTRGLREMVIECCSGIGSGGLRG